MMTYLDCWVRTATALFAQALAGEPQLVDGLPKPLGAGACGFAATLNGDQVGRFSVLLDAAILDAALVGEGVEFLKRREAGVDKVLGEFLAADAEVLSAIGRSVSDAAPVFENILNACQRLFAVDRAGVYLVDGEVVRGVAGRGGAQGEDFGRGMLGHIVHM